MSDSIIPPKLDEYCESMTSQEHPSLQALGQLTLETTGAPQMLSGFYQGRLLSMLSKLLAPQKILEIGTFTGYSAVCLAEGLAEGGEVLTIDPDQQWFDMFDQNVGQLPASKKIKWIKGKAEEIIPDIAGPFDLVFIDAAKKSYKLYFDLLQPALRSGSLIIADNVLWKGKVLDKEKDGRTLALHEFNEYVSSREDYETILLPIRDGLLCSRKK